MRALAPLNSFARELHGIAGLWYAPCVLRPGILTTQEELQPTSWEDALEATLRATARAIARETGQVTGHAAVV